MFDVSLDKIDAAGAMSTQAVVIPGIDGNVLFEALICDLHWTMLHVGTLAQLATACSHATQAWTLRPWRHLTHESAAIVHLALRYHPQLGLSSKVAEDIAAFVRSLSDLKKLTRSLMVDTQAYSATQRQALTHLAGKWKELCRSGSLVLQSLEMPVAATLVQVYAQDGRMLAGFLREAASGDTQRVSPWGEITLPVLKQRRRTARASVERACRLILADLDVTASILDLSIDGVGIACKHRLAIGQALQIDVGSDRRLHATVVRCDGPNYGLRLTTALRRDDPLFGLSRAG